MGWPISWERGHKILDLGKIMLQEMLFLGGLMSSLGFPTSGLRDPLTNFTEVWRTSVNTES
jgi:hypothetical protein